MGDVRSRLFLVITLVMLIAILDHALPFGAVSFVVINPILDGPSPTLDVSYKHYWKNRGTLEIGHRGMGTYYLTKKEKDVEL